MSKKKSKKKSILHSRFYQVYFALVALALILIVVGTVWLRGMLAEYESAQPVHVAEDVTRMFQNADFEDIYAMDTAAGTISGGDRDFYVDSLTELTRGGDVQFTQAFSPDENARNYTVTLNGDRFATFTLVPSGETTGRGYRRWKLGSVTTNVTLREPEPEPTPEVEVEATLEPPAQTWQCHVTAPEGYVVSVAGEALTEANAVVTRKNLFEDGFLPPEVANPVIVDYEFTSDTVTPEITAVDAAGAAASVNLTPDKALVWSCPLAEDEAFKAQYGSAALALGKRVAKFISRDAGKGAIQKICAKGSPAETIFENLTNTFTTPHTGADIKNEAVSEFYKLSDTCFTCHVSFNYVLHTKNGERDIPTAYTFCVIQQGGKGWLYNMLSF